MAKNTNSILTEEFLYELFFMAFKSPLIVSIVSAHVKSKYLPDKAFQSLHAEIAKHYKAYKDCPSYGAMMQKFSTNAISSLVSVTKEFKVTTTGTPNF